MKVNGIEDLTKAEHPVDLDIMELLDKLGIPKEKWYEYSLSELDGMMVQHF